MNFYYNEFLSNHWLQLATMIEDAYPQDDDTTVVLGCYVHKSVEQLRKLISTKRLVIYQLEPLVEGHWHSTEKIVNNIRGADEVWDYDLQNIEVLAKHGIEAKFRPPAFSPRLQRIRTMDNPDIDVLFYGSYTDHRCKQISSLINEQPIKPQYNDILKSMNFVWLFGMDDARLDEYISRSKIILNMKPTESTNRQQQTRIYYPLINNKCVLSEASDINYFGDLIHQYSSVPELHDKLIWLLSNDNWKHRSINYCNWIGNRQKKNKIAVFYHLYQAGDWASIFEEQVQILQSTGIYDAADYIHIGINGNEELPYHLTKINRIRRNERNDLEADTLHDMWKFCQANPDYSVLYLHAKGVTWSKQGYEGEGYPGATRDNVDMWRHYLQHFVFHKWEKCIENLKWYDCVGTEWEDVASVGNETYYLPHYAGNFWWARASYISRLDPSFLYQDSPHPRWLGEFWIGTGKPKYFNYHNTNRNKYMFGIDPSEYKHL